jgi:hypothetical protein
MSRQSRLITKCLHAFVAASVMLASAPLTSTSNLSHAAPLDAADAMGGVKAQQPAPAPAPEPAESDGWTLRAGDPVSETVYLPLVMHNYIPGPQAAASVDGRVEPWAVLPGDWVTGTLVLSNTGELPLRDGVLIARLPVALGCPSAPGATYEALGNE